MFGTVSRPNKQLKGFDKVELEPGQTKTVTFSIGWDEMSFIGLSNTRIVEPGEFMVTVGGLQDKFSLTVKH